MQNVTENIMGTLLPPQAPSNVVQRRKNQRYGKKTTTTYLGLIAHVIQDSPDKMLTFTQLMDKLGAFLSGDRKGIENNIRVCLSSNDCFVKVPVSPYMPHSKNNFWKVDESQITAKMARRHFKGILDLFPELSTKVRMETEQISERFAAVFSPPKPTLASPQMQNTNEVNFSSPFSIESILNRDSPSRLSPTPAPLSVVSSAPTDQPPLRAERGVGTTRMSRASPLVEMNLVPRAGHGYPSYRTVATTVHGIIGDDDGRGIKNVRMCAEPSYPKYSRPNAAPRFADPPRNCYLKYPVPRYACAAHHFGL